MNDRPVSAEEAVKALQARKVKDVKTGGSLLRDAREYSWNQALEIAIEIIRSLPAAEIAEPKSLASGTSESREAEPSKVLSDILAEREHQDEKWGGPSHDDQHRSQDWYELIDWRIERASTLEFSDENEWVRRGGPDG